MTYLGVILANNTNAHSEQRVKATRRAFYALQGSGVCKDGVNPETMTHIFNTAIRPVLTYGLQCVYQNKAALEATEKLQCKLLKAALGLKRYCKNTPLLEALKIPRISTSVEIQELVLFRSMFLSTSRTSQFYHFLLSRYFNGYTLSPKCLLSRVLRSCDKYGLSVIKLICDGKYVSSQKRVMKSFVRNDGVVDTIRFLLCDLNLNRSAISLLLSPF